MRRSIWISGLFLLGVVAFSSADDDKKLPTAAARRPPLPGTFQAWMVTGKHAGRFHSPVCEIGLHPFALVVARDVADTDQPLADLIKKLDQSLAKHAGVEPGACAVFLLDGEFRDTVDKGGEGFNEKLAQVSVAKEQLERRLQGLFKAKELSHVNLALATEQALADYKLDEKAHVAVLLCYQQDVLARFDLPREKLTEEEAGKIAGEFEKLLQKLDAPGRSRRK
jgi:hypothetical protein